MGPGLGTCFAMNYIDFYGTMISIDAGYLGQGDAFIMLL